MRNETTGCYHSAQKNNDDDDDNNDNNDPVWKAVLANVGALMLDQLERMEARARIKPAFGEVPSATCSFPRL